MMVYGLKKNRGFTLLELMVVVAIIATLAAIAYPMTQNYVERALVARTKQEIRSIQNDIVGFSMEYSRFPSGLDEIGLDGMLDPFGNPYQYLRISDARRGEVRKDHNLVPVNTDFDLYSMGRDGQSKPPFTAKASRDDIVRANNGQYIGPVGGY